ncbi:hypothetical protein [Noviherbaspirillum sp. UKPF54]|uniref:hypothetical protein n=1 Tax=Noviherbaspirillum sp. UKPF54 TaxID=2601898 RepID=UPI0011B18DDB|nr:hypothetical protein [Noviherbaspirillum sp. UKPF54]QDZ28194.1 hypothetical protein FAY22_09710 [Noviherbaspirillum sp. UKPF54]
MRHLILLLTMTLAACATTGSGGHGLSVETVSHGQAVVTGANCTVSTGGASWNVITPATVPIESAGGDLRVVCSKPGYRTSELIVKPSSPVGSSMGVGVGGGSGNVGVGVGLNFPIRMGGGGYPSRVTVELNPQ